MGNSKRGAWLRGTRIGAAALTSLVLGGGCRDDGAVADTDAESETDPATVDTEGPADSDDGSSSGGDPPDMPGANCGDSPGRVGLHRLTRAEYNRTVRDLFGVESSPADLFPPDPATDGFDNHAQSLSIDAQLASLMLDAAEIVAAEAMQSDTGDIIACDPGAQSDCADDTIRALALRVYRRPPTDAEVDGLLEFVADAQDDGDTFEIGVENAIVAMLMAPQFLYRSVPAASPEAGAGEIVALDDYALASRMSYFLWGSTPDDALLARAAGGELRGETGMRAEFDRMLADPKADALFEGFVSQWLSLGRLDSVLPDPDAFPIWNDALRDSMHEETRRFFEGIRSRDASALEFVVGTQTYANAALAEIYGVDGPTGDDFESIATDEERRAGVLTMPAILAMTSDPERTNIVKRGVWLAENILCAAPPPPPPGIGPLPDPAPDETERERLERHRSNPSCASCHMLIDPLGFGLESYDVLGQWRDEVDGQPVDNLGELPSGEQFSGAVELGRLIAADGSFSECVSEKMMTYALGRTMTSEDDCRIEEIASRSVSSDSTFSDLLWTVVTSDAFQTEVAQQGDAP